MKMKKLKFRVLTFTILSNDANKVVTRLRIPRVFLIFFFLLSLVPITLLFYYMSISTDQQTQTYQLANHLASQTTKADNLQAQVDRMEAEKSEVIEKIEELVEIELQLQEFITELPAEANGGISIPVDNDLDLSNFSILDSPNWITRYKRTLAEIDEVNQNLKYIPTIWPTEPDVITSEFGVRNDPFNNNPSIHTGIDVRGKTGTPVYAGANGTVTKAEYYGGYGNTIIIHHSDTYQTLYSHLSSIEVSRDDSVEKGEVIGSIGSTGRSTGSHLHYEIIKHGEPVDPWPYFDYFNEMKNH